MRPSIKSAFSWQVVGIEKSEPLEQESDYADELTGMIERTRVNANAIILEATSTGTS
jgi:hypothetical protein